MQNNIPMHSLRTCLSISALTILQTIRAPGTDLQAPGDDPNQDPKEPLAALTQAVVQPGESMVQVLGGVSQLQQQLPAIEIDLKTLIKQCCERLRGDIDELRSGIAALRDQVATLPEPLSKVITRSYSSSSSRGTRYRIQADGPFIVDISLIGPGELFVAAGVGSVTRPDSSELKSMTTGSETGSPVWVSVDPGPDTSAGRPRFIIGGLYLTIRTAPSTTVTIDPERIR